MNENEIKELIARADKYKGQEIIIDKVAYVFYGYTSTSRVTERDGSDIGVSSINPPMAILVPEKGRRLEKYLKFVLDYFESKGE